MRFTDALIRANKDFDLLVVPNGGHGMGVEQGRAVVFNRLKLNSIETMDKSMWQV